MGIRSLVVNGETWDVHLEKVCVPSRATRLLLTYRQLLYSYKHQAIFTSPEMVTEHLGLRKWLKTDLAADTLNGAIVDEAHCIPQWAKKFRKHYGLLNALRSQFPLGTPMHAYSATMEPDACFNVCQTLRIDISNSLLP
jgi:superfamily II DNA helicase RecQ